MIFQTSFSKGVAKKTILDWQDNQLLRNKLDAVDLPTYQDLVVPVDGGFEALVRLQLPKHLDKSGRTKYPLVLYV